MKCNGCATRIREKLSSIPGLSDIRIDLENDAIEFNYKAEEDLEAVRLMLNKLGYPLGDDENSFVHFSKSYVNCMIGKIQNSK